jgi:hypothetical protein
MDLIHNVRHMVETHLGVTPHGLLSLHARLSVPCATKTEHIAGCDFTVRWESGCLTFYAAMPPLEGHTIPRPSVCPMGVRLIRSISVEMPEAIDRFHAAKRWRYFTELTLAWPMTTQCDEPLWNFRTGDQHCIIGAQTGRMEMWRGFDAVKHDAGASGLPLG